jgi:hypothetical protein
VTPADRLANDRHFDRVYKRIDELAERIGRLERNVWLANGALGTGVLLNLLANILQQTGA